MPAQEIIKILAISDLHWYSDSELEKIKNVEFDICVILGDVPVAAIKKIKAYAENKPVYAVAGNHDDWNTPELGGADNIHGQCINCCGLRFVGFSGSVQYISTHTPTRGVTCSGCGRTLHRTKHFYCKNSYVTGEKPCFKGSLKQDILYKAVLEKVKHCIEPELSEYRQNFSFSAIENIENSITELKEKKAAIFDKFFTGELTQKEFEKLNNEVTAEISLQNDKLSQCRKAMALNTKYGSERPIDTLKRLYEASELTKEHMQFVKRINVFNANEFEIIMQEDSPLAVLCSNMDIYEEV